jgi:hypothetical protein
MSNIHLISDAAPGAPKPGRKTYKPREKKISAAEMARVLRTADSLGLTIYSFTVEAGVIRVVTKPEQPSAKGQATEVDSWFASRG